MKEKRGMILGKRGAGEKAVLWITIAFIIIVLFFFFKSYKNCGISQDLVTKANSSSLDNLWAKPLMFLKKNILKCEIKNPNFIGKAFDSVKGLLGFNEGFFDFGGDLLIGVFVGLWLWLVYLLASLEGKVYSFRIFAFIFAKGDANHKNGDKDYLNGLKDSWLSLLANSIWKIIPIAIVYAVVMQIPVINSFIKVVTLEPLLSFKGTMWGSILKSFIIAFYIGFLPTGIEQYSRYKIRKKYYAAIEWEKAAVALEQERIKGRR